ncbi:MULTISPECIES: nitrogen fixation protein NifQ [unclassified Sinorhizobium]|uniref:nitrogen fixation protein NifQ n=1 Tax=unclassified Sinorhizobium TaxID=2613772 RepID=UPI0024C371DB|nr:MULTISPECIES: nitrogen fixation protein NifQ [unclassified Sinorhizobium]MDK1378168.1 nitrogen fixation protein NifQ [Sinorhizobium sp. 6-70]MDK1479783.1 nitrogen fixation protein NifQ [Sinorhizobium sp. 6-117]
MSDQRQIRILWGPGITRGVRMSYLPRRARHSQLLGPSRWPRMDVEMDFDDYVLACVLSRALEEIDAGEASATEATGLSRAELRDILTRNFPASFIHSFSLGDVSDPEIGVEEELLRGLLLTHARPGDPASARFAKIIARRALRNDHLWQDLGLFDRSELSRLLATHFPNLAAGNTENMKWKKYLYYKLCEAEGFSLCSAPSCRECHEFKSCFGSEEGESRLAPIKSGTDLD